jgi:molybdopterin molybdotransferase
MILVEEADEIIQSHINDFGVEKIQFESAVGRVLAEDLKSDRDLPPFNRVTMDGIAINYHAFKKGIRSYYVKVMQAAGDIPVDISVENECIEIMTGAALPETTDTIIRYEDLNIQNGIATVTIESIKQGQFIHAQGKDKKQNEIVAIANQIITPALTGMCSSIGKKELLVKKMPRIIIISSGHELIDVHENPSPYQIRRSNNYTIKAALQQYSVEADMLHIPDNPETTKKQIKTCLKQYDIIILSGGISMGKLDFIPQALKELSVENLFYKVKQRPGKPFWFGKHPNGVLVFAFPGNPVSVFMCLYRYFLPWLKLSLGLSSRQGLYAVLNEDFSFKIPLQYFLQVKLNMNDKGQLIATPVEGNGSGDFANLLASDAFMELPLEQDNFTKGEAFRIWPFKEVVK